MSRPVTFIHAADLHLDAPFKGIDAEDPRVRETLIDSTYTALDRVVSLAEQRSVDFVIVAGDVYNSRDKSLRSQLRFAAAMERLAESGIPAYLVQGNHDPADGWSAGIPLPASVHYFPTSSVERVPVVDSNGEPLCALYGRGYATAATTDDLAAEFERDARDETAIGVLHANVGGQPGYEPYAPTTLDVLRSSGMDYWALGHIHKPVDLLDAPRIRYAGSPQGLNPTESGPHGCWLVTMERGSVLAEEFVPTASVLWSVREIDASPLDSVDAVRSAVMRECEQVRGDSSGCPVILRLELEGRTEAHSQLARATVVDDLLDDVRGAQMSIEPWIWVDRLRDRTRPVIDVDALGSGEDFIGDLVRIADGMIGDPDAATALVEEAMADVESTFGRQHYDAVDLVKRARDLCLDRLLVEEDR